MDKIFIGLVMMVVAATIIAFTYGKKPLKTKSVLPELVKDNKLVRFVMFLLLIVGSVRVFEGIYYIAS